MACANASPVSVVNEVRTLVRQQPDVLLVGGTTAQVIATGKALRELNANIPIIMSTHNGLTEVGKGIDLEEIEGSYSVFAFAPDNQENLPVRDLYNKYHTGAGSGHRRGTIRLSDAACAAHPRTGNRQGRQG